MTRVLIFRHIPFEGAGRLEPLLAVRGIAAEYVDLYRESAVLPETRDAAGLIFLGGFMSANDDLPYLRREMDLIAEAAARRTPVLGICLGAQMIAKAAGARVYRNHQKEIGWFDIRLTEAGAADRLFAGVNPVESVFHWHGETFDLPRDAAWLAYSERCRHQAFRIGGTVYGLQFHLEVTPEMIADWCAQDANCGDVRELESLPDPRHNRARLEELSGAVFGAWCGLLGR
jgi:GMP synthase (glutamine-hydrolysing)